MKIEIGESLMYSWLRHNKLCELAQTNWKASENWVRKHDKELQKLKDEADALFPNLSIFGKKKKVSLDQYIAQAEIDVIGLSMLNNKIYAVDIAFHENGLGYGKTDENIARVIKKSLRSAMNVYGYYDRKDAEIIFATPKVSPKLLNKLQQSINDLQSLTNTLGYNFDFKIIVNDDFFTQILKPVKDIVDDIKDTNELFVRSCHLLSMYYAFQPKNLSPTRTKASQIVKNAPKHPFAIYLSTINNSRGRKYSQTTISGYLSSLRNQLFRKILTNHKLSGDFDQNTDITELHDVYNELIQSRSQDAIDLRNNTSQACVSALRNYSEYLRKNSLATNDQGQDFS